MFQDNDLFSVFDEDGEKQSLSRKRKEAEPPTEREAVAPKPSKLTKADLDQWIAPEKARPSKSSNDEPEKETIYCSHDTCLPPDSGDKFASSLEEPVFPANPCRTWKFNLDPFQRKSIACLERGESVLVSAHTSAGKTVIAE